MDSFESRSAATFGMSGSIVIHVQVVVESDGTYSFFYISQACFPIRLCVRAACSSMRGSARATTEKNAETNATRLIVTNLFIIASSPCDPGVESVGGEVDLG